MKYVIIGGQPAKAIVFSELLVHRDMVPKMGRVARAGYCSFFRGVVYVWGESISLGKHSMRQDATLLANMFGLTPEGWISQQIPKTIGECLTLMFERSRGAVKYVDLDHIERTMLSAAYDNCLCPEMTKEFDHYRKAMEWPA